MTQYTNSNQERNILLIGRTGNGKSTLANVLTNSNAFVESDKSVSVTKDTQIGKFNLSIGDNNVITYKVIDTVGFGDTQMDQKEVMLKIAELSQHIKEGLNQVFFVVGKRFTKEEIEVFNIMREVLFGLEVTKYITLVRTSFSSFENEDACQEDIRRIHEEKPALSEIIKSCSRRIIYVNNPPINIDQRKSMIIAAQESREISREKIINHLILHTNNYHSPNIDKLNERINSYMSDKEKLETEKAELEKKLTEEKNLNESERVSLNRKIKEIESERETLITKVRELTTESFE